MIIGNVLNGVKIIVAFDGHLLLQGVLNVANFEKETLLRVPGLYIASHAPRGEFVKTIMRTPKNVNIHYKSHCLGLSSRQPFFFTEQHFDSQSPALYEIKSAGTQHARIWGAPDRSSRTSKCWSLTTTNAS